MQRDETSRRVRSLARIIIFKRARSAHLARPIHLMASNGLECPFRTVYKVLQASERASEIKVPLGRAANELPKGLTRTGTSALSTR